MTMYQKIFQEMLNKNREAFKSFEEIHAQYALDPEMWQEQFNQEGEKVLEIIRDYEDRLCSPSQGAGFASFTPKLADKFRQSVRDHFPLIDRVGVIKTVTSQTPQEKLEPKFNKIKQPVQKKVTEIQEKFTIKKIKFS